MQLHDHQKEIRPSGYGIFSEVWHSTPRVCLIRVPFSFASLWLSIRLVVSAVFVRKQCTAAWGLVVEHHHNLFLAPSRLGECCGRYPRRCPAPPRAECSRQTSWRHFAAETLGPRNEPWEGSSTATLVVAQSWWESKVALSPA